jgi:hypothetical protein
MTTFPLNLTYCPRCSGSFELFLYSFQPHYGLLSCACGELPIVYSIPVLVPFEDSPEVLRLIKDRETKPALIRTLAAFAKNPELAPGAAFDARKKAGQDRLMQIIDDPLITFQQTVAALCPPAEADAMFFRYAQGPMVAAMALMGLSPDLSGNMLHVGCGAGHLERTLSNRIKPGLLMGIDESFPLLYAARKYMAADSHFMCVPSGSKLPFKSERFTLTLVTDRGGPPSQGAELMRVTRREQGAVLHSLVRGDLDAMRGAYKERPVRTLNLMTLLKRFVNDHIVDATANDAKNNVPQAWVVTRRQEFFRRAEMEDLMGCRSPRVNPVYLTSEIGEQMRLERRSDLADSVVDKGLLEAGALPDKSEVSKSVIKELQDGHITPTGLDLLFRLVLVDLPLDYA